MKGLKNKVVVVTGGAGGIGSATCRRLAEEGAKVAIFDMNLEAAEKLANEINNQHGQALAVQCDITQSDVVEQAVQHIEAKLGPIGWSITQAGIFSNPLSKAIHQEWDKLIQINLVVIIRHACKYSGMVNATLNALSILNAF